MEKRSDQISITKLLILSNCLIMVIFFSLISSYSQRSYKKILEKEFEEKQDQMLIYISDHLEQSMESIELLARSTTNNYTIINNILNYRKNQNSYEQMVFQNNMNQNLSSLAYSLSDIVSVNILMDDKHLKTTKINGVYDYTNYTKDDCAFAMKELCSGWIPTRMNDLIVQYYGSYITSYVIPIYSGQYYGDNIGQLVINLKENLFYESIKRYTLDDDSVILLIDETGIIMSATDRSVIGNHLSDTRYASYQLLPEEEFKHEGLMNHKIYNQRKLDHKPFSIIAISNYERVIAPIRQTQSTVLFSSITLLMIFSVFSGMLAYKISKPILTLSKKVTSFKIDGINEQIQIPSRIYEINVLCREFNHMTRQNEQLVKSLLSQEIIKQKKELEILQEQINPHFLYNTLEVINWMALSRKQKEISNMVIHLGSFLRLSLNKGKAIYQVRDELNHLRCYLEIQNVRSNGKLIFSTDIQESVLDYKMIKLLLQPLVENSILHGFDSRGGIGQIWVKAYETESYLYFHVIDDGCGMDPKLIDQIHDLSSDVGYGLKNVMKRIVAYYGEDSSLVIRSTTGGGTTIEIKILKEVPVVS